MKVKGGGGVVCGCRIWEAREGAVAVVAMVVV